MSFFGALLLAFVLMCFWKARKYADDQVEYWLGIALIFLLYGCVKLGVWLLGGGFDA